MTQGRLVSVPHELIPFICNAELRRSGFADRSLDQIILGVLWLHPEGLDSPALIAIANAELQVDLTAEQVALSLSRSAPSLMNSALRVQLTSETREEMNAELNEFEAIEEDLRTQFEATISKLAGQYSTDRTWDELVDTLLIPMIRTLGVLSFDHLFFQRMPISSQPLVDQYLQRYPEDERGKVRSGLDILTRPANPTFRTYFLKIYGAYFAAQSAGLTEEDLALVWGQLEFEEPLKLFLDTNVLFSILGLRDHHCNTALGRVRDLITEYSQVRPTVLYVTPQTLDEARDVLASALRRYQNVHVPKTVGRAAQKYIRELGTPSVDGLLETFIAHAGDLPDGLRAEDYFGERIRNLLLLAREKGVELYNAQLVYDVAQEAKTQEEAQRMVNLDVTLNRPRPKSSTRAHHDATLRGLVRSLRGAAVESPLECNYWLVTLDMRLLLFERDDDRGLPVPCCLHPSALIQLLEYWLPRSAAMEDALLENFRLPVVLRTLDPAVEAAMHRILEVACVWAESRDLLPEAAVRLFFNEESQRRIRDAEEREGARNSGTSLPSFYDLVQEEVSEQYRRIEDRLSHADAVEAQVGALMEQVASIDQALRDEHDARVAAERELQRLTADVALRKSLRAYWAASVLALVLSGGVVVGMALLSEFRFRYYGWLIIGILFCVWGSYVSRRAIVNEAFAGRRIVRVTKKYYRSWWVLLLALVTSLLATVLFESGSAKNEQSPQRNPSVEAPLGTN